MLYQIARWLPGDLQIQSRAAWAVGNELTDNTSIRGQIVTFLWRYMDGTSGQL